MAKPSSRRPHGSSSLGAYNAVRTTALGLAKVMSLGISAASAAPLAVLEHKDNDDPDGEGTPMWILLVASMILVLLGGAFAGLTIALMGQDGIYLQVLARDETEPQHKNAGRVFRLLQRGKHWVLVTLLLSNVIVNETLPVVLDRCLGGGVAAVVGSTFLIVIFGEVLPQSVCVRYGLPIGGYMSKPVLLLMWLMAPIAWPTAKLLDWVLGEDHGTVYKKSGLKTLVTLHRSLGEVSERLNQDEVTIISAVLDLKEKPVENVMTPMQDVFVMSEDTVLDEKMMDLILSAGYSRIPIHEPGKPTNFVGMLLVKILITYDPEDAMRVQDFPLATLPETRPETSCLDIVNFFQEGKSHMVLVSEYPGEDHGALGVVTLEDVIEELIGEEIIDESDVYIDVHKAIRRLAPAPHARIQRRHSQIGDENGKSSNVVDGKGQENGEATPMNRSQSAETRPLSSSPQAGGTFLTRRSSVGLDGQPSGAGVSVRANLDDLRQHLRHLGPSNPAHNPKNTASKTVKVKPGIPASASTGSNVASSKKPLQGEVIYETHRNDYHHDHDEADESAPLLRPPLTAKDGVQALHQSYGSARPPSFTRSPESRPALTVDTEDVAIIETHDHATQTTKSVTATPAAESPDASGSPDSELEEVQRSARRLGVRSGSITENVVESRGIRKVVLEAHSSTEDDGDEAAYPHHHMSGVWSPGGQHAARSNKSSGSLISGGAGSVSAVEEEEEEEEENEGSSGGSKNGYSPAAKENNKPGEQSSSGAGAGGAGAAKKKNRRKKRKGSKS